MARELSGFIPLGSSVLSSELDYEIPDRKPLRRLSLKLNNPMGLANMSSSTQSPFVNHQLPKSDSRFSFSVLPSQKRPKLASATLGPENRPMFDDLEDILFKPIDNKEPSIAALVDNQATNEGIESESRAPSDATTEREPFLNNSSIASEEEHVADDLEHILFANDLKTPAPNSSQGIRENAIDPFLGEECRELERAFLSTTLKTPTNTPRLHKPDVTPKTPGFKYFSAFAQGHQDSLSPKFCGRLASRAIESNKIETQERLEYARFVSKLCKDEPVEDDEDEDDIFDIVPSNGDSDELLVEEAPRIVIPTQELISLFDDVDVPPANVDVLTDVFQEEMVAATFDEEFIEKLNVQIALHFQLLVQSLALAGEIKNADQIWVTSLKLMIRFKNLYERSCFPGVNLTLHGVEGLILLLRILRQSPLHDALLKSISQDNNDPDLRLRAVVKTIPFAPRYKDGKIPCFSKSFWHILSIFSDCYDWKYALIPKSDHSSKMTKPFFIGSELMAYRRNDSFTPAEDQLLYLGLQRFGLGNWEKIQSILLPTRTAKQLYIRYKNMATRRAPDNPIKTLSAEMMKPLNELEERLLLEGYKAYGKDWEQISKKFLPHRPAVVLRRRWQHMMSIHRTLMEESSKIFPDTKSKISFLNTSFISDDEDDSDYIEAS